jgi:hypothetical protein
LELSEHEVVGLIGLNGGPENGNIHQMPASQPLAHCPREAMQQKSGRLFVRLFREKTLAFRCSMGCRTDRCHSLLRETLPVSDAPGGQRPSFGCTFTEGGRKTFSLPPWACHFVLKYSDLHPAVL